jgi:hypothetical protein
VKKSNKRRKRRKQVNTIQKTIKLTEREAVTKGRQAKTKGSIEKDKQIFQFETFSV